MSGRVKFKDFSRTFKAMYQQIQGLNTEEEGVRNQQNLTLNCSKSNFIRDGPFDFSWGGGANPKKNIEHVSNGRKKIEHH